MAVFRVEKNKNYTVMSNYHLKDKSLTLKSKGLLSLILSLPDEWNYTTRGLAAICKEGVDCIGSTLRELESAGYLERNQLRDEKGRISDTEYVIYESPQDKPHKAPKPDKPDTPMPSTPLPCTASPHTENPYMGEPATDNPAQSNTDKSNSYKNSLTDTEIIHQSIMSRQSSRHQPDGIKRMDKNDGIDVFHKYRELIEENIEYVFLIERYGRAMLDEIMEIMLDAICGKRDYIRIGGAEYPAEVVKGRLLKLNSSHIEYVIDCIRDNTTKIGNIKAYMLTTLYNAPATMDSYYTTLVNHDMANGFYKN